MSFWWFQSLGRDSGCSSLVGEPIGYNDIAVSIPRSGFWVFKHPNPSQTGVQLRSFNPSVGILGVQASRTCCQRLWPRRFQSLGRDSGCSSIIFRPISTVSTWFQSLGRDSGCSSYLRQSSSKPAPRFQSLGRDSGCSSLAAYDREPTP